MSDGLPYRVVSFMLKHTTIMLKSACSRWDTLPKLTLLGRCILLITAEILANAICWTAAGLAFGQRDGLIGLALLAWTIGLRHGLDADHISAIDNSTRHLVSLGKLPITCGLFFSLGHSTIVIVVNVAIAISVDIADKLDGVGNVGGIIGAAVSGSFLFLIACINIYFLVEAIRHRQKLKRRLIAGLPEEPVDHAIHGGGLMVRIVGPLLRAVDRPWKMYPVGILFGFGFDTASSIALLAVSAVAQKGPNGVGISHGKIVILPFLFTAGMSLVDSLDSILMLYAYAEPSRESPDGKLQLFQPKAAIALPVHHDTAHVLDADGSAEAGTDVLKSPTIEHTSLIKTKANTISMLSIILTVLSIVVALSISLITIMGLIGENCQSCTEAAQDPDGGGLAGSWWRAWAKANDQSGYIGAGIVGAFAAIVAIWWGVAWGRKWYRTKQTTRIE